VQHCSKINIAGSVRRRVPEPGDIEICCIPLQTLREDKDLFGEVIHTKRIIHPEFDRIVKSWGKVVKGDSGGRYMQIEIERTCGRMDELIIVDLFMPQPNDYYRQYAIRTGSAEYAKRHIADQWVKKGWRGTVDGLRRQSECYTLDQKKWFIQKQYSANPSLPPVWEDEAAFFRWLGVQYMHPQYRNL
jgi:DNA polymerase/3'-5' exonuclease PolX